MLQLAFFQFTRSCLRISTCAFAWNTLPLCLYKVGGSFSSLRSQVTWPLLSWLPTNTLPGIAFPSNIYQYLIFSCAFWVYLFALCLLLLKSKFHENRQLSLSFTAVSQHLEQRMESGMQQASRNCCVAPSVMVAILRIRVRNMSGHCIPWAF